MDYLAENMTAIFTVITSICGAVIAITSFLKAMKSEKRTRLQLSQTEEDLRRSLDKNTQDVIITREGIVQGFKDAIVTKDLKISINKQVEKVLNEGLTKIAELIAKHEAYRTKVAYWNLRILEYTAASDKLTTEQKSEIYELLAMIADEEQIVDTLGK